MIGGSMVIFVIGANSTGKSRFIERHFAGCRCTVLNVRNYQKRTEEEERFQRLSAVENCLRPAKC